MQLSGTCLRPMGCRWMQIYMLKSWERSAKLNSAPYGSFINPLLVPIMEGGEIMDVRLEYPDDFTEQMLYYSENYSNL